MSDLTEFLLARISEDQAEATGQCKATLSLIKPGKNWPLDTQECEKRAGHQDYHGTLSGYSWFDSSTAPWRRVLAECEAKRKIVGLRLEFNEPGEYLTAIALDAAIAVLATVYRDHPDYDERWDGLTEAGDRT